MQKLGDIEWVSCMERTRAGVVAKGKSESMVIQHARSKPGQAV